MKNLVKRMEIIEMKLTELTKATDENQTVSKSYATAASQAIDTDQIKKTVQETIANHDNRRMLILSGIPEKDGLSIVKELFKNICIEIISEEANVVEFRRLGKPPTSTEAKPRLIRIEIANVYQ